MGWAVAVVAAKGKHIASLCQGTFIGLGMSGHVVVTCCSIRSTAEEHVHISKLKMTNRQLVW
jgi:hypothetical protein